MGRFKKNEINKNKTKVKVKGRPKGKNKNNEKVKDKQNKNKNKENNKNIKKIQEEKEEIQENKKQKEQYKEEKHTKERDQIQEENNEKEQKDINKKVKKNLFKKIKSENEFKELVDKPIEVKNELSLFDDFDDDEPVDVKFKNDLKSHLKHDLNNDLKDDFDNNLKNDFKNHFKNELNDDKNNLNDLNYDFDKDLKDDLNKDVTPLKLQPPSVKLETTLKEKLKNNIMTIMELSCNLPSYNMIGEYFEEKSVLRTAESIVLFCHKLNLSLPTMLTALVYLQLYKNSSRSWRSTKQYSIAKKNTKRRKFLKWDEQYLTSAACVLLAWKYKEDEIGLIKSTKKLFDLSVTLYKIIVSQSSRKTQNLSVSSWMLQDSGEEIRTLKSQIVDRENQLLHALDYFIGPIPLPDSLITPYVKLFLISMTDDFTEHQSYAKKLADVVSLLVVDFYKTQMCIEYTPNEIVAISIIKASCLLSFLNPNDDVCNYNVENANFKDTASLVENKLIKFISSIGDKGLQVNRIVSGILHIQKYSKIFKHSITLIESF